MDALALVGRDTIVAAAHVAAAAIGESDDFST
jgi:hypothetical protein